MAIEPAHGGSESRALIERWNRLHAVGTALGFAATGLFFWALLGQGE
jgi:hypothetical protein